MYGKFFSSTFTGSMYGAGANVFAVWGYVIANTVNSTVELNPKMVAAILGMTSDEVSAAIEYLCQPDMNSRNKNQDGRRLLRDGQFQFKVVSHVLYRQLKNEEERREYNRVKQQESRARRQKTKVSNEMSNSGQSPSPTVTYTEAETYTDIEARTLPPEWISQDSWNGFVEMRKKIHAPLTSRAISGIIKHLSEFRDRGQDPNACLDQSTERAWRGVFEINGNGGNGHANQNANTLALNECLREIEANHEAIDGNLDSAWSKARR